MARNVEGEIMNTQTPDLQTVVERLEKVKGQSRILWEQRPGAVVKKRQARKNSQDEERRPS